ncbi:nucleotidyltransferase domain-containing protein [Parageobacillus toebii NBRC 107807]|uniref:Nucleotidyltransferase n=1 Tax=Parageobacillus toebii NBRC 107807 TaxID=1223503 RepID=A0A6G9J5U7_9BACL|nr:nucleotidyltransferase domain-containing protein [Parageobacillus toebii]MBB3867347.1 putative nucleotidyltransferase [Parageobacillus toebii NBRC 107807]QIQ34098.1 nucleotidyltransferase domain-containing protein [Parageobacillus toebii NBRC 107807]QSB50160.1 nucleotidyltransferase domain-containing protein [Parageobacillus toebii]
MNHDFQTIVQFLVKKINPYVIYLFGSEAQQQARQDSDIDLAFLSERTLSHYERFMIAGELAAILNCDVDLVDLKEAATVFQAQVVGKGKVLYCADDDKKAQFEMKVFKEYAKLNEERAEILERIRKRGAVYE